VTARDFRNRLMRRARRANASVAPEIVQPLEAYFRLLERWNAKINLTALPLRPPTDETFDRLFVEPLAVARYIANDPGVWLDFGSGGGSPAIPLKVARPRLTLTMVESKVRKAAFLREAVRTLKLPGAEVENARFEALARTPDWSRAVDLITVRAVRADPRLLTTAAELLSPEGRLFLFRPSDSPVVQKGLEFVETAQLTDQPRAFVAIFRRAFHVEQSR
jgi:16S rRNA (guanine527-N7)-methyltransferase